MSEFVLYLENIRKSYKVGNGTLDVLKGVNFSLEQGEWVCIYGASGSGKTTLLNIIGLLERPDSGIIRFGNTDASGLSRSQAAKFRSRELGFVFQSYHLLPELSILDNVAVAGRLNHLAPGKAQKRAAELLASLGLAERLKHRPSELSGGEQQRAAIARALINDPPLLLADEPTGNLDPHTGEEILQLFETMRQTNPALSILMITHNHLIANRANRAVELRDGVFTEFDKRQ